jgi:acetylornithine deacetylase
VVGRRSGAGGGRSLLLSGHVDVVPALGEGTHGFWDGDVEDGRLYGRGAWDMKAGVACALHAARCLAECDVALAGDVIVESVVDEEFGGANGTLAARLRGHHADGAVLSEPTGMTVCHATRGGIQYRLNVAGGAQGMGFEGGGGPGALTTLARISAALDDLPRDAPLLQYLLRSGEELPWGPAEGLPGDGVLEFWAEITPGTDRAAVDAELRAAVDAVVPEGINVKWEQRPRFLEAADAGAESPIVQRMRAALGTPDAPPAMAPFACDAFMFAVDATPVVIRGPRGGNAHAPDEWVLIDDLHSLSEAFVRLAMDWCGEGGTDDGN